MFYKSVEIVNNNFFSFLRGEGVSKRQKPRLTDFNIVKQLHTVLYSRCRRRGRLTLLSLIYIFCILYTIQYMQTVTQSLIKLFRNSTTQGLQKSLSLTITTVANSININIHYYASDRFKVQTE